MSRFSPRVSQIVGRRATLFYRREPANARCQAAKTPLRTTTCLIHDTAANRYVLRTTSNGDLPHCQHQHCEHLLILATAPTFYLHVWLTLDFQLAIANSPAIPHRQQTGRTREPAATARPERKPRCATRGSGGKARDTAGRHAERRPRACKLG